MAKGETSTNVTLGASAVTTNVYMPYSASGGSATYDFPTSSAEWLRADRTIRYSGGVWSYYFTLKADANPDADSRSATVRSDPREGDYVVYVTQEGQGSSPSGGGGNKYAVCVGINKYDSKLQADELSGCVNDAEYFHANLAERGGWPTTNMVKLTDGRATKTAIRQAISNCAAKAVAGDTFVYMQSSHGGWNYPTYDPDLHSVYLLAYDNYYEDTEMAADLRKFAAGVKVVVVVDACHSGGLFMGTSSRGGKAAPAFDLAGRVTALMEADRTRRQARGENVAKSLSASEIGWVTAANYNETSIDFGSYDTADWLTNPDAEIGQVPAGTFLGAFTWGWWDGSADARSGYGDNDGYADAYECWKSGYDYCVNIDEFFDTNPSDADYPYSYTPQCTNVSVLRSVELGRSGDGTPAQTVPLPTALDNQALSFTTGGNGSWFGQTGTSHDGTDAAQSGSITNSQSTWLETTVDGPGTIGFWWNTSCETNYDGLVFTVDGTTNSRISGAGRDWEQKTVEIASGSHVLRWTYAKDGSQYRGSDCGWVDQVTWTPTGAANLSFYKISEWPDSAFLTTSQGGTNSVTAFETGTPVYVSFSYDNSGTADAAPHHAHVLVQDASGGLVEEWWHSRTNAFGTNEVILRSAPIEVAMPAGGYTVSITLDSTGTVAESDETDNVRVLSFTVSDPVQTVPLPTALDNQALSFTTGGNGSWFGQTGTSHDGTDAAQSGSITNSQSTWLETTVDGPGTIGFWWNTSCETNYDGLVFTVDGTTNSRISGAGRDWEQKTVEIASGSHVLRWTYAKDGSQYRGSDCGWVDQVTWTPTGAANLSFYKISEWPDSAFLTTSQGGTNSVTAFETGTPVYVSFSYDNSGTADAAPHHAHVLVQDASGGLVEEWWHSRTNAFGTNEVILRSAPIEVAMPAGGYTVSITLDSTGTVAESDETDNMRVLSFSVVSPSLTVTFDGNGGTPGTQTRTYTVGGTYGSFPSVSWSNHVFAGWFTEVEGGTQVEEGDTVTADVATLHAHWTGDGAKADLGFFLPDEWPTAMFLAETPESTDAARSFTLGTPVYLHFGHANFGEADAGEYLARVAITDASGNEIAFWYLGWSGLESHRGWTVTDDNIMVDARTNATITAAGTYTVTVVLDPEGTVDEIDESDNSRALTFDVTDPVPAPTTFRFSFGTEGGTRSLVVSGGSSTSDPDGPAWVDSSLQVAVSGGTFTTTISIDCHPNDGAKRMGTVTVDVDGTEYAIEVVQDGGFGIFDQAVDSSAGLVRVQWVGENGKTYAVRRAPSLDGPWTGVGTVAATADGVLSWESAMPGNWTCGFFQLLEK